MIQNILDQQDFYLQFKVIFADGIILVIITRKQQMNSVENQRLCFVFILKSFILLFNRFWNEFLNITDSLSIILNDDQSFNNLNDLFSQLNLLKNYTNIWNGKLIKSNIDLLF